MHQLKLTTMGTNVGELATMGTEVIVEMCMQQRKGHCCLIVTLDHISMTTWDDSYFCYSFMSK
jgi:hypothetical protein